MLKTILLLIVTIIIVPLMAFYYDDPLTLLQRDMIKDSTIMMLVVAAYCFIVGELTKNNSQVDKLWSIVPIIYAWYFAIQAQWDHRLVLMALLVTLWGIRLTYNLSRRGAYSWKFWTGEEDYRWEVLRKDAMFNQPWKWSLFNLFFICLYQNALILLFTLPSVKSAESTQALGMADYALAVLILAAIVFEYIADQQQYDFQSEKYLLINAGQTLGEKYKDGFVSDGLWKYVRHPNYLAEQTVWVLFYFFSVIATGHWINWSAVGCLLLILLFQGSADFSEKISASKYPNYKNYIASTARFFPKIK